MKIIGIMKSLVKIIKTGKIKKKINININRRQKKARNLYEMKTKKTKQRICEISKQR